MGSFHGCVRGGLPGTLADRRSQYAQRARAIQSKPHIQHVVDDSDKQAVIDRLRAEIAFLRDQIRNSERGDRRNTAPQERAERQNEREVDLQNQLLDLQESYSALGHRHAKLISEIAKAQEIEGVQGPSANDMISGSALERLKRSNTFAEAVEQVVLEYEKTIQTLETSLANTRSSLASTESSLLEKESKCAYSETMNQQLQARLQKMMDRENSTENYLNELETKLDGHTSGEEKNAAIIVELRKEIARVRENEAGCEDYISTLEERLAEADQDAELMQREITRLEHVVDRQRSLGKLDTLLYELDHAQHGTQKPDAAEKPRVNGHPNGTTEPSGRERSPGQSPVRTNGARYFDAAEEVEDVGEHPPSSAPESEGDLDSSSAQQSTPGTVTAESKDDADHGEYPTQSPAQSQFVAEKLETVTQELLDLRMEHETTVTEFDLLSAKYEEALRNLAQLQDAVDEARHSTNRDVFATPASTRPSSFLGDPRVSELREGPRLLSSSRSLSLELSSAGELPSTTDPSDAENAGKRAGVAESPVVSSRERLLHQEVEELKELHSEKEKRLTALTEQHEKLQEQHQDVLDEVEELKTEISKAKMSSPTPTPSPFIRRKSGQNVMMVDRAHRSFASLRNIAAESFEDKPDVMQNFELHLNTALHELYARSERVQALEAEISSVKKEMETKMTIISGLTRERSSLKNSSPMDISVVSTMRDQLLQSENKIRVLQETQSIREKTLLAEIEELKASLEAMRAPLRASSEALGQEEAARIDSQDRKVVELQEELGHWESRHQSTVESMQASESKLIETIREMDAVVSRAESQQARNSEEQEEDRVRWEAELERERSVHREIVNLLQDKVKEYGSSLQSYKDRTEDLEHAQADARRALEESIQAREKQETELSVHRDLVSTLERQVQDQQLAIQAQEDGLRSLREMHESQLDELQQAAEADVENRLAEQMSKREETIRTLEAEIMELRRLPDLHASELEEVRRAAEADAKNRLAELTSENGEMIRSLQAEITEAKDEMGRLLHSLATILNEEPAVNKLQSQMQALVKHKLESDARYAAMKEEVDRFHAENTTLRKTISELTSLNEESVREIERLNEQYQKSSRIVEDLEEQLTANFDQHLATNNRLSVLESERNHQLEEVVASKNQAVSELEAVREELARLEVSWAECPSAYPVLNGPAKRLQAKLYPSQSNGIIEDGRQRSSSITSNLRKSASAASLPSPPPAIPLPPLPTNAPGSPPPGAATASRHHAKDHAHTDELEARIRTIENSLLAEKQLNFALEEALADLETQGRKAKEDVDLWKKKAWAYEDEIEALKNNQKSNRYSMQAVEEERNARKQLEAVNSRLEESMRALNKKKKKSSLNCF